MLSLPTHGGLSIFFFFFFKDTATTEIYPLSLHDALPISCPRRFPRACTRCARPYRPGARARSEEHTSELQSRSDLVCRLLLEQKKKHRKSSLAQTSSPLLSLPSTTHRVT